MRLRATITFEYDTGSDAITDTFYGTTDPDEVCKIDRENFEGDPAAALEASLEYGYDVAVEVIG